MQAMSANCKMLSTVLLSWGARRGLFLSLSKQRLTSWRKVGIVISMTLRTLRP